MLHHDFKIISSNEMPLCNSPQINHVIHTLSQILKAICQTFALLAPPQYYDEFLWKLNQLFFRGNAAVPMILLA